MSAPVVEEVPLTTDPSRPGCVAGTARCDRPVVAILTAGCVHEHIRRGRVCAHHLGLGLICRVCHDNPVQPHGACDVLHLHTEAVA